VPLYFNQPAFGSDGYPDNRICFHFNIAKAPGMYAAELMLWEILALQDMNYSGKTTNRKSWYWITVATACMVSLGRGLHSLSAYLMCT